MEEPWNIGQARPAAFSQAPSHGLDEDLVVALANLDTSAATCE
jgi:hypothetical protein